MIIGVVCKNIKVTTSNITKGEFKCVGLKSGGESGRYRLKIPFLKYGLKTDTMI